jgi:hypothetical protein
VAENIPGWYGLAGARVLLCELQIAEFSSGCVIVRDQDKFVSYCKNSSPELVFIKVFARRKRLVQN